MEKCRITFAFRGARQSDTVSVTMPAEAAFRILRAYLDGSRDRAAAWSETDRTGFSVDLADVTSIDIQPA